MKRRNYIPSSTSPSDATKSTGSTSGSILWVSSPLLAVEWSTQLLPSFSGTFSGQVSPRMLMICSYSIRDFSGVDLGLVESRSARNALWYFITAIVAAILIFFQQYFLIHTAETLTGKLRSMMFRGILRQDIAFFDEDKNSTGALTSKLADQPQKVQGLAGVTLGTIVQSISTIVTGMIIGLIYGPKLAAIGMCGSGRFST